MSRQLENEIRFLREINSRIKELLEGTTDSGKMGKIIEPMVKCTMNNIRGLHYVTRNDNKGYDTIKKGIKYEIKSNNGELFRLDENGDKISKINADYFIYFIDLRPEDFTYLYSIDEVICWVVRHCYIVKKEAFLNAVEVAGVGAKKYSTAMCRAYKNGTIFNKYYDRYSLKIQSDKRKNKFYDLLEEYAENNILF